MLRRLALLTLLAVLAACGRGEQRAATAPPAQAAEAVALSPRQIELRSASCRERSRAESRTDRSAGAAQAPEGLIAVGYTQHYNAKLDTCFLLRSVRYPASTGGALRRTLVDVNERERYGEYLGPVEGGAPGQRQPDACHVAGIYCASEHEWEVLAGNFMAD